MSALRQQEIPRRARAVRRGLAEVAAADDRRVVRLWLIAWLGGSLLGVVNGVARELLYKDRVGDVAAHNISTASLIALVAVYMWLLDRKWPIPTLRTALKIGGIWFVLTILFEFGFGHYVDGKSWSQLFDNYNVARGRMWSFVVIWMTVAPALVRKLRLGRGR